jgi:GNAT superfamily N-acetyltransferase
MFVARSHRGSAGLADQLMNTLVDWATSTGHVSIVLGTTDRMTAAHHFYAKHHFVPLEADHLPTDFPRMAVDSLFFRRDLAEVEPS